MKTLRLLLLLLALAGPAVTRAPAQGAILFANRIVGGGINAPVTYCGPLTPGGSFVTGLASGTNFLAQLIVNGQPAGQPVPFREGAFAGYVSATAVYPEGVSGGTSVTVTMVAWFASLGSTYQEAFSKQIGGYGSSGSLNITAVAAPGTPADLVGLQPFSISGCIPEPGAGPLLLVGAVFFLLRRR
jgi:hypothetical protein